LLFRSVFGRNSLGDPELGCRAPDASPPMSGVITCAVLELGIPSRNDANRLKSLAPAPPGTVVTPPLKPKACAWVS
jgi:hypothetical protein